MDSNLEDLNEISEYESFNMGIDYYEGKECFYDSFYVRINEEKKTINNIIDKKKKDMMNFVRELSQTKIPKQANEENEYRILSFPWCICGLFLVNIKLLNLKLDL